MRLKISILTTLVAFLVVLSFYVVYSNGRNRVQNLAFVGASLANESLGSQKAYVLPLSETTYFPIRNSNFQGPVVNAKSFLVYDTKNDKIIFSKDSQKSLPIASLTKLLSAVVAVNQLEPDSIIEVGSAAINVDQEGADFYLGEKFYFKDLLKAMLVKSSNDAAMAIAKEVEKKTNSNFVDLMNRQALEIGMTHSDFLDPAGLNDSAYSTAEDLLKLTNHSKKFADIWSSLNLKSADIRSADNKFLHHLHTTDKLLDVLPNIAGGKTGYTDGALGCMILEVRFPEKNTSLVIIVLGSNDRFGDVKKIADWTKTAFRWE